MSPDERADSGVAGGGDGETDADAAARAALERARESARGRGSRAGRPGRTSARSGEAYGGRHDLTHGRADEPYGTGRDPVPVASSLERLLSDRGWREPLSIAGVIARWRDVVGDHLADHCEPETFEEGALVVRADSTAWAMQVRLLLPQLERRLGEEIGEGVVTSITVLGPGGPTWRKGPRSVPGRGPRDTYG